MSPNQKLNTTEFPNLNQISCSAHAWIQASSATCTTDILTKEDQGEMKRLTAYHFRGEMGKFN